MKFKQRNLEDLGDLIVGNNTGRPPFGLGVEGDQGASYFPYRTSSEISQFFEDLGTSYVHNGETRHRWVASVVQEVLSQPSENPQNPPELFCRLIDQLMDPADAFNEGQDRSKALAQLNVVLSREGFEAFYGEDRHCYLRNMKTRATVPLQPNPNRPLTAEERLHRKKLEAYLERCSEDELIQEVLLPLFRQLGFHRVTESGHRDKALEYGKDIWMRFSLPTNHFLYFGVQVKKGKLDAAGASRKGNSNVAEVHHQILMMLEHEVFDPEINRRVLIDHAFIIAGGEITKSARNWLSNALNASKRRQIIFMGREEILDLCVVNQVPLPEAADSTGQTWTFPLGGAPF